MNKTFIVVLAICLVSVHAMVKRDAPAPATTETKDEIAKLQEQINNFAKQAGETLKETFDPEKIKKNFNELVDQVNKGIQKMQTPETKA